MSMTFSKKLNKKARKLMISYPVEDISKDYETIKKIVYNCQQKGLQCYFSIDSNKNLRYFLISSENWRILKIFAKKL